MTQSAIFGENWSHIRDYQSRGISRDDARELFHITKVEFQPPSRAHLKRIKRERPNVIFEKFRAKQCEAERVAYNAQAATAKELVQILRPHFGKPVDEPNPVKSVVHVLAPLPKSEREHDAKQAEANKRQSMRRDHLVALHKCRTFLLSAKHSMEILEIFGDFESFERACA